MDLSVGKILRCKKNFGCVFHKSSYYRLYGIKKEMRWIQRISSDGEVLENEKWITNKEIENFESKPDRIRKIAKDFLNK